MKKIYIACPANTASGGPELLHQLCYYCKKHGINATMFYYSYESEKFATPIHERYLEYEVPYVLEYEDSTDHMLVVPEVAVPLLDLCQQGEPAVWWLSIDHFYLFAQEFGYDTLHLEQQIQNIKIKHYVQSYYAWDYLIKKLGIDKFHIFYLSDYLNTKFFTNLDLPRRKLILFNPAKGYDITKQLISASPQYTWIPLAGLTPQEVMECLHSAKVYVDFGNHPGKDRIPREAAISGCCVITNKQGSAAFEKDVPIPQIYKFEDPIAMQTDIFNLIQDIFNHFPTHAKNFGKYRNMIRKEEKRFEQDVIALFQSYGGNTE